MIKSISALAIFGMLGLAVVALPGFAPQVGANETVALAKGDRLPVGPVEGICSRQIWPNFEASCLRDGETGATVREARLTTARRS
jgi:hypothetical protein